MSKWCYFGIMPTDETRTSIRLSDVLLARLRRAAERDHRSVNSQMVAYIEQGLDHGEDDHDDSQAAPHPR